MTRDTPNYGAIMLASLKKWLTDDTVCGARREDFSPCLRISVCQDRICGLRRTPPDPK